MTVPTVTSVKHSNSQIRGIQARGLSAPDEAAYKAALVTEYQRVIQESMHDQLHHPSFVQALQGELTALQTLTSAQLATLQGRGSP